MILSLSRHLRQEGGCGGEAVQPAPRPGSPSGRFWPGLIGAAFEQADGQIRQRRAAALSHLAIPIAPGAALLGRLKAALPIALSRCTTNLFIFGDFFLDFIGPFLPGHLRRLSRMRDDLGGRRPVTWKANMTKILILVCSLSWKTALP
jgi:hypothetical protein